MRCLLLLVYLLILCSIVLSYKTSYGSRWVNTYFSKQQQLTKVLGSSCDYDEQPNEKRRRPLVTPEFSRIINISQLPKRGSIACRLLAKPEEREKIAKRLKVPFELRYFAANTTIEWKDPQSLLIKGKYEAHQYLTSTRTRKIVNSFETLLQYIPPPAPAPETTADENPKGKKHKSKENSDEQVVASKHPPPKKMDEYDDEIGEDGNVDIGEISTQSFGIDFPFSSEYEVD
jgi:hypothetical protein